MTRFVYEEHQPCGCGSNRPFGSCCLKNGAIKLKPRDITPAGVYSGHRNRRCFLSDDRNCCPKTSGDHFVSRAVLRVLDQKKITVSTAQFTRTHSLDSSSLKTKQLCKRHNEALSPIDAEAARFFSAFSSINDALIGRKECQHLFFFNGWDIERWLWKTGLMAYFAGFTTVNHRTTHLPDFSRAFFRQPFPEPFGMYLVRKTDAGGQAYFSTKAAVTVALGVDQHTVCRASISLGGLEFHLLLRPPTLQERERLVYRPKQLVFFKGDRIYSIWFAWDRGDGQCIMFSQGDSIADTPTGVFDSSGSVDVDRLTL